MADPKSQIPSDLLSGLYRPEYRPVIDTLNEAEFNPALILEQVEKEIQQKIEESQSRMASERQLPLSPAESEVLDREIDTLQAEIAHTRGRIADFKAFIDSQARPAAGSGESEVSYSIDIHKKPMLKRAVKAIFGHKATSITYSMYLEAKKAKKLIEEQEADEYVAGAWEE